jgi:hypothetical protein
MKKIILVLILFTGYLSAQTFVVNDMKIVKNIKNIETKNLYDDTQLEFTVYDNEDKFMYTVKKVLNMTFPIRVPQFLLTAV